ncbi:hypothetical protein GQ457_08G028250 [Hibiscus cannabinus]
MHSMMALHSMMTCVSLTLWRQEGKEDQGITFVQVRFYGYGSMYKQWGGPYFCIFGLRYRYSSVVSVPNSNTGIRVSVLLEEYRYPLICTLVSIPGEGYRYPFVD